MAFFVNLFRYWTSSYLVLLGFSSYEWVFCGRNGFSPGSTEFRDFLRGIFRNFTQFYWVWWPRRYRITGRHSRHSDWCFFYDPTPVPISARGQLDRAISQSPIDRNSISNDPDGRPPPSRPRHAPAHTKKNEEGNCWKIASHSLTVFSRKWWRWRHRDWGVARRREENFFEKFQISEPVRVALRTQWGTLQNKTSKRINNVERKSNK